MSRRGDGQAASQRLLLVPQAPVDPFDAKTPMPGEWTLDPSSVTKALTDAKVDAGVRRLQALARGFLCRRHRPALPCRPAGPFVPTPSDVIETVLDRINPTPDDVLVDLGCGDARFCIAAASRCKRVIGVEKDDAVVQRAARCLDEFRSRCPEVAARVQLLHADFLGRAVADVLRSSSIVWVFLTPAILKQVVPVLVQHLPTGARLMSYAFPVDGLGDPVQIIDIPQQDHLNVVRIYRISK